MHRRLVSRLAALLALCAPVVLVACGDQAGTPVEEQHIKGTARGRIEIFIGEDAQFYFRVIANNNEKLLRSEGFTRRAAAEDGIESAKAHGVDAKNYELFQAKNGEWMFNLVAKNGETIGTSETYTSKSGAERGLTTLQQVFTSLTETKPAVTCSLERLASISPGGDRVEVDFDHLDESGFGSSDSLSAFEGVYSFDVTVEDRSVNVTFYENAHVQDEVGSFLCDIPKLERGTTFCNEPIEVDKNLGTDGDFEMVHAFDFGCRVD